MSRASPTLCPSDVPVFAKTTTDAWQAATRSNEPLRRRETEEALCEVALQQMAPALEVFTTPRAFHARVYSHSSQ
jgi:hypothetical protein